MKKTPTAVPRKTIGPPTAERLAELNAGRASARNLAECLAVDQAAVARAVLPALGLEAALEDVVQAVERTRTAGISRQVVAVGEAFQHALTTQARRERAAQALRSHGSDAVRGWATFFIGRSAHESLPVRLEAIRPLADDVHFSVREWAWMAVRPFIAEDVPGALAHLRGWCEDPSAFVRRFAVESTRPRGVWCPHIGVLKEHPEQAEPLLEALKADDVRYVQDSVANWINDASKSQPRWALRLCERWDAGASASTRRIIERGLRTVRAGKVHVPQGSDQD